MDNLHKLDRFRIPGPGGVMGDHSCGAFLILYPGTGRDLRVIVADGNGWDHVSVSLSNRTPNWSEMSFIKDLFFGEDETAMQLHLPKSDHINIHPHCLHLWRPQDMEIPMPPRVMV